MSEIILIIVALILGFCVGFLAGAKYVQKKLEKVAADILNTVMEKIGHE